MTYLVKHRDPRDKKGITEREARFEIVDDAIAFGLAMIEQNGRCAKLYTVREVEEEMPDLIVPRI